MSYLQDIQAQLDEMAGAGLIRRPVQLDSPVGPRVQVDGRELLCLCSNDYLCLADDPRIKQAAIEAIHAWGVGSGASRLVSGTMQPHVQLEAALADFKGTEAALVTSTGWMANQVAISALASRGDLILCDKLNHASIVDASLASGARVRTYRHGDTDRLEQLLARHRGRHGRTVIVTDAVFSMDGDLAPLERIVQLSQQYEAILVIDEAHGTGVLGQRGRGAAELLGVEQQVDLVVGTLSKALGGLGGFIAAGDLLIRQIRNTARPYIYTTAPPPAICRALVESLRIVRDQPQRRRKLLALADRLRRKLGQMHLSAGDSASQIIPIVIGEAGDAVAVSQHLLEAGFLVPAIRPPTVPRGSSRLRVSLCSGHTEADIDAFCRALPEALAACGVRTGQVKP